MTPLKRPWCWERLKMGGEGDDRGWDGWMASPIQWTCVWAGSGVGDGQGSLACCSPWGHKESDTTQQLTSSVWSRTESLPKEYAYQITLSIFDTVLSEGFHWWLSGKELPASARDTGLFPGLGGPHMPQDNEAWHHSYRVRALELRTATTGPCAAAPGARTPGACALQRRSHRKQKPTH